MITGLKNAGHALIAQLTSALQKHPKRATAALAAVLLTGGSGAFAVANLGPDPANLPVRTLTESVASLADGHELAELTELQSFTLYRSETVRANDTAESLLQRLGIADPQAAAFMRANSDVRQNVLSRTGRLVSAEVTASNELSKITVRWAPDEDGTFRRLTVERKDGKLSAHTETDKLVAKPRLSGGVIRSNFFASTDDAGIPDSIAAQMSDIFEGELDFRRGIKRGDRFAVAYEALEADGEPLRAGRVLSTEFHSGGKVFQAIWFQEEGQKGAYYTLDGKSKHQAFLNYPVKFSRISSGFAMRMHPIQHTWKAHLGTDFAAATGTEVRTVGDGTVSFAGVQNGYGNVIFVEHANQFTTVYAHLSSIDVKQGQRVEQGTVIGAVGSTGWATGPHLHFELREKGEQRDPLTLAQAGESAKPISKAARPAFEKLATQMRIELNAGTRSYAMANAQ